MLRLRMKPALLAVGYGRMLARATVGMAAYEDDESG
jgi:hypothetical protein